MPKRSRSKTRSANPHGRKVKRSNTLGRTSSITNDVSTAVSVPRALGRALPPSITVTLRYFQQIALDPVGGGVAANVFRANSCYDCDLTGAGHQPLALDQWMGLYTKGTVLSSKITTKIQTDNFANTDRGLFGVVCLESPSTLGTTQEYIEADRSAFACYVQAYTVNQECSTGFGAKEFFAMKDVEDEVDMQFSALTNPDRQAYFHAFVGAPDSTTNPGAVTQQVLIEYRVRFAVPKVLASS